jgi:hypothetical protein
MEDRPVMTDEQMIKDYPRLKLEYTRLHEDFRRLQSKQLIIGDVINKEPKFINKGIVMICDNCNKEYKEYHDPSKRNMPLCNDCLPF